MSLITKTFYLLLLILFSGNEINAQECNGALGDPVINNDFGRGSALNGNPTPQYTNYPYMLGTPNDGWYTIVKNTFGMHPGNWHQITNHTPNDGTGYMMVVNSDDNPKVFYENKVSGLCAGTTYQFSAWIINLLTYSGKKPNVTFTIETSNGSIYTYHTGDINEGGPTDWKEYKMLFTTTNDDDITIKMMNNGPGGNGNDIALDDITFKPCGPKISPIINNKVSSIVDLCEGVSSIVSLSANISNGYATPAYQWQRKLNGVWQDIPNENLLATTINFPKNSTIGVYYYRLLIAEQQNINSTNCRVASNDFIINILAKPTPVATLSGTTCTGSNITLNVNGNTSDTFKWTGPNGYASDLQNPVITNLGPNQSGNYEVTVTTIAGCTRTSTVLLTVLPKIIATTNFPTGVATICDNSSIPLVASGGTSYRWEPIEGLSSSSIANPIATPTKTTTYTVFVTNGGCTTTTSILINVTKSAKADAGADQKALAGESVNLEGKASGDNITYLWSPPDYLDDATKLNPVATPPKDMVYTLSVVQSDCGTSTDNVYVKIYPKVEIKNTFTPNGDGKNDTWNITALEAFPTHKIKVVNRNGQTVFNNKGSYLPWDGKFNQKDVPVGSYYYTIYLNNDFKTLSGWVFVMR